MEHPDKLEVVTEVDDNDGEDDDELISDEADSNEDELLQRFNKMTFVVATRKLDDAQTVPANVEPEGLGVDRHDGAEVEVGGQVALVKADGHRGASAPKI